MKKIILNPMIFLSLAPTFQDFVFREWEKPLPANHFKRDIVFMGSLNFHKFELKTVGQEKLAEFEKLILQGKKL